jgi:thiamine transport system ATP-binding protein
VGAVSQHAGVGLEEVSVSFGELDALQDLSLDIKAGEFFTLVGPSGCGKTTTLRVLAGFESPTTGEVTIDGHSMRDVSPDERPVGIVFQNYALFPHMSVRENVAYALRYRDPPAGTSPSARVDALLDLVDMGDMGERDPEELSGGQQQRVALARALAPGPDVLLLDEPLSALDARLRERLRRTVREIQRELGTTTIYVTHDQAEALAISDRVAVMNDGRVEQVGTPEAVYREPATRFVAEFVGDTNILSGSVVAGSPPAIRVEGQALPLPQEAPVTAGESIDLCVRPEAFEFQSEKAPGALPATVQSVEFTGDAYRVHCETETQEVLVTTRAQDPPCGSVHLRIDPDRVHIL